MFLSKWKLWGAEEPGNPLRLLLNRCDPQEELVRIVRTFDHGPTLSVVSFRIQTGTVDERIPFHAT